MNQYPSVKVIFDRRKKASSSRSGNIEIEILYKGKRKWISTGIKVLPENWHPVHRIIGLENAFDLNLKIENLERPILDYIRQQMVNHEAFSWIELQAFIEISKLDNSFIDFVEKVIDERKDIRESTRKNHLKLVKALKSYGKLVKFNDLNRTGIIKFEEWLRSRYDYEQSTIASYHKFLKIYVNEAIRREIIRTNPYLGLKIDRGNEGVRKYLTPDELDMVERCTLPNKSLNKVRDVFIFQCYTGLAYSDLLKFDFNTVIQRNGHFIINDIRQKTQEKFYIVLLPYAMKILEKYGNNLPVLSNQQYNLRLKVVGDIAGVSKPLTTHMARHTYASMCLNAGIKIEVLAQMLGHTDIKTTQIYAKMFNTTVEAAFDQLEENLRKRKEGDAET